MPSPTDDDLLFRLCNFEDHFVERKTEADKKDWCKTVCAFANSTPLDFSAVLFIGVEDDGTIRQSANLDTLQKTLGKELDKIYPTVYYESRVLTKDGKQFLAVVVPGSKDRPHFSGPSYVRIGSQSIQASDRQFNTLISERNSKVYEILKWKGTDITIRYRGRNLPPFPATVVDCNQFYVTLQIPQQPLACFSLKRVDVSFTPHLSTLELEIDG